jgi:uncharacterized protein (DUF58 family)
MGSGWWLIVGLLALAGVVLHHNLLFLMSLLSALVGGTSELWRRYCLAGVSYHRRLGTSRLFHGEETDLLIEIVNAKPLPLAWLRIRDEFPSQVELLSGRLAVGHRVDRRLLVSVLSLRWYEQVTRRYRLRGVRRGVWRFGPLEVASGDIFGLGSKREKHEQTETLLVYPRIIPITALGLPAHQPFGDERTQRRLLIDPLRLMSAREYQPGDSYRYIHWKTTARRQSLQTKVFEPSASRLLAVFLNINTFEFLYEGVDLELAEFAITTAASIARHAWGEGYQVGLYVNSVTSPGGERIRIRPGGHPEQLSTILEALARVVEYGRWPIEAVLAVEAGTLPYGTTVVTVTARINDRLRKILLELRRREHAVSLVALGQARLDQPLPGVRYWHVGGHEKWHELESLELA